MRKTKHIIIAIFSIVLIISCSNSKKESDAYGNFEAKEIIVSSENTGKIIQTYFEEGDHVDQGQKALQIDTIQLHLKKEQLQAQKEAIISKTGNINAEIETQRTLRENLLVEKNRIEKLLKDGAATQQAYDKINGEIDVVNQRIQSILTQNKSVLAEITVIEKQILQIEDQIKRCLVSFPVQGIVLIKYAEAAETVIPGKALFKIAYLDKMQVRAYISGNQLAQFRIGDSVQVLTDKSENELRSETGFITWISSEAEFTPKVIQTKEERINLVYAIKVSIANKKGYYKIGMPAEIKLYQQN